MIDFLTVIIPTYNPDLNKLNQTLEGLKNQTLKQKFWELIIIDNNSGNNFTLDIELSWIKNLKIVKEIKQGLTYARVKGFLEARGEIIILVDDDNILNEDYLQETLEIFNNYPALGVIGGKSIPIFENDPPEWLNNFYENLALRDPGEAIIIVAWQNKYPVNAPIGAGMAIRKEALQSYITKITTGKSIISDRNGKSLNSGGDNDIVLEIIKAGWQVGYFPALTLKHLIPKERMQVEYLARLVNNTDKSWIQLLESHQINPWPKIPRWTVPLRKIKAWFIYKAWLNKVNYIKWNGACGTYEGLSE